MIARASILDLADDPEAIERKKMLVNKELANIELELEIRQLELKAQRQKLLADQGQDQ